MDPEFSRDFGRKLQFLFDHSNDAVVALDEGGVVLRANDQAGRFFGCATEALVGRVFRELRTTQTIRPLPYASRADGLVYEAWFTRCDQSVFLAEVSFNTAYDGDVPYYIGVLRDVTAREQVRERERLADEIFQHSLQAIVISDTDNRILAVNPAFERITGYRGDEVVGRNPRLLQSGCHDEGFYRAMWEAIARDGAWQGEIRDRRRSGELYDEWLSISVLRDGAGAVTHYIGVFSDISELNEAQRARQRLSDLYAALSRTSQLVAAAPDEGTLFSEVCRIAVSLGGMRRAWVGLRAGDRLRISAAYGAGAREAAAAVAAECGAGRAGRTLAGEALHTGKAVLANDYRRHAEYGHVPGPAPGEADAGAAAAFPVRRGGEVTGVLVVQAERRGFFDEPLAALLQEIADGVSHALDNLDRAREHREAAARLERLARYDTLTGLYRREVLEDALHRVHAGALRRGGRYGVVLADLDRFKVINDTYGHAAGDRVLVEVAGTLRALVRDMDWIGRWGGEEFLLLVPEADAADVGAAAERARHTVAQLALPLDGRTLRVTLSAGVASYPDDGATVEALLARADAALYRAKDLGGDQVVYGGRAPDLFRIGARIEEALEEGRVIPAYQPIVSLADATVVADEALARIRLPDGGTVAAAEFIDAATRLQLVHRIDAAIARAAMARCATRLADGGPACLHFVNFSTALLSRRGHLERILAEAGCHCRNLDLPADGPKPLVIEITERTLLADRGAALAVLRPLLDFGFRLALDDFGSGYSSFLYLADLPVSFVKIEMDLVRRVTRDRRAAAIVEGIAALATRLETVSIAEGIEDAATAQRLRELGVDWGQGFHFGRPMIEPEGGD